MADWWLLFFCLHLLPLTCHGFLHDRGELGGVSSLQQTKRFSTDHPFASPQYEDAVVQQQIDAYLEERSQRQMDEYLALMSETSGKSKETSQQEDGGNLMKKIKDSGVAGIIAFATVQIGFWVGTFPFVVMAFYKVTNHFPDFNSQEDMAMFGGESFAFVNVLRLAAPFRIGFALKLVPWIEENVIDRLKRETNV